MRRKLIPNVPEIPYDGNNPALFITLLGATLKALGEICDTAKLSALSGEGNRFCWMDNAWVFGNELTESISETPFETEYRVLSALGWRARYIPVYHSKDGVIMNTSAAQIRRDIVSAIDKGFPVLIRYVEHSDCDLNVFFGYEDDGQKIIGYNCNEGFEVGLSTPTNTGTPVTWENWENNLAGYIMLEEKNDEITERDAALSVFRWISDHARKAGEVNGRRMGLAGWESFLSHLELDDFFELVLLASDAPTVDGIANSVEHRFVIYCDALCQIYARKAALPYYESLAKRYPEWREPLEMAIQALDECAGYGGFLWEQGFTFDPAGYGKFRSPVERKNLAEAGREAMCKDKLAVEQFEKILDME